MQVVRANSETGDIIFMYTDTKRHGIETVHLNGRIDDRQIYNCKQFAVTGESGGNIPKGYISPAAVSGIE
jgi:hypothetical protein